MSDQQHRLGVVAGFSAYGLWGVFPLVFRLLDDVSAVEILFHRIAWSLVVVVVVLAAQRRFAELAVLARHRRSLQRLALAAVFISVNWLTYIWAVNSGHVVDAALGYYVNPLFTVALGVAVLHERLRPAQRVALGFGVASVLVLTVANGRVPWVALVLAASFGMYG
ncbi:MAG TPA: EamA family transporter, partial [Acidimicrobiales bacterium]|nr:EamA family transporter [Acidimicrobiales bacterium]